MKKVKILQWKYSQNETATTITTEPSNSVYLSFEINSILLLKKVARAAIKQRV